MSEAGTISISGAIQKFGNKLFGFIRKKVNTKEDAEDILQDVWYQLSNFGNISDIEHLSAWLYRVAGNKITDKYRKKKDLALDDYTFVDDDGAINFKEILLLDDSQHPDLAFFKELFWKELILALEELPDNQREVFVLNEFEDLTLQDIANKQGENIKTIISRKGYAVKYLRKKLNYLYQELNT